MNIDTKPIANSIGVFNLILPPYNVVIQLNTFTADGTAIIKVNTTKKLDIIGFTPDINMWCAQTINERKAIANMDKTIARYPKMGFRECTDKTSDTKPIAGRIII
jgi:hypothetical protein